MLCFKISLVKIFHIVSITIRFSKSSDHENENNYKASANVTQTSPEEEAKRLCLMMAGQTHKTRLGAEAKYPEQSTLQDVRERLCYWVWGSKCRSTCGHKVSQAWDEVGRF